MSPCARQKRCSLDPNRSIKRNGRTPRYLRGNYFSLSNRTGTEAVYPALQLPFNRETVEMTVGWKNKIGDRS